MQLEIDPGSPDPRRVRLTGRMDSDGVAEIEVKFLAATAGSGQDAIADLSEVTFLASLGIRLLVEAAKALANKERRLVVVVPDGDVGDTIRDSAVDLVLDVVRTEDEARIRLIGT
jgi:anti-anti-sigma factor